MILVPPVMTTPITRKGRAFPFFRRFINKTCGDVYVAPHRPTNEFKVLKLKTLKKLYDTNFVLSNTDYGEYTYKTFVFNRLKNKPVEIVVKPEVIDIITEQYGLYNSKKIKRMLGDRAFRYFKNGKELESGSMHSYAHKLYSGLGVREHQIAIERMFMLGQTNVNIYSLPEAYKFHKNCGFIPKQDYVEVSISEFEDMIQNYAKDMRLSTDKIKRMLVYKKEAENILLNCNATFANFLDYAYSHRWRYPKLPNYSVEMKLSDEAIEEWKKIIAEQPIMIGKNIPEYWPLNKG